MKSHTLPFDASSYTQRRKNLMSLMESGRIVLLGNENSSINFEDNYYPFRQDSTFLYYIGIDLPGLNAVIDVDNNETLLFGDDISIDHIIWMGDQEKLGDLAQKSGITKVLPSRSIFDYVDGETHYLPPYRAAHALRLEQYCDLKELNPSLKLILSVIEQRNIKTDDEIKYMHEAASLTAGMHRHIMQHTRPGLKEYELVGMASQYAIENNARWSFTPILTRDGHTLHNHSYNNSLRKEDMLLFDGGIEHDSGYAGDMTRSYPVSGRFTSLQKDIYDLVVKAHDDACAACKPGTYYKDIHLISCQTIAQGLIDMGIMKGDAEEAVMENAHSLFFQHGLGHLIGLDVHDMENLGETFVGYDDTIRKSDQFGLKSLRLGRQLKEGYAITIEPGIYIIPHLIDIWKAERKLEEYINYDELSKIRDFGGIRVENDYYINAGGAVLLGDPLSYKSEDLARLIGSKA